MSIASRPESESRAARPAVLDRIRALAQLVSFAARERGPLICPSFPFSPQKSFHSFSPRVSPPQPAWVLFPALAWVSKAALPHSKLLFPVWRFPSYRLWVLREAPHRFGRRSKPPQL